MRNVRIKDGGHAVRYYIDRILQFSARGGGRF